MKVRCRHCGSLSGADALDETGQGTCTVCGRALGGPDKQSGGATSEGTFDPIDWSSDTFDLRAQGTGAASKSDVDVLGALPTDDEALDISELLEGTAASITPAKAKPEGGGQESRHSPRELLPSASQAGWRIKNARGVVFEFDSAREVSTWLGEQTDVSVFRVARAGGPFQGVQEYPELSIQPTVSGTDETGSVNESAGVSDGSDISDLLVDMDPSHILQQSGAGRAGSAHDDHLELDYNRASHRHGSGSAVSGPSVGIGSSERMSAAVTDGRAYGFRAVLIALLVLFAGGHAAAYFTGVSDGFVVEKAAAVGSDLEPPGPQLNRAIQLLNEGKNTAATRVLQRLSKRTNDPRVFRYLATALYKTDRAQEAKLALEEYRKRSNTARESK